MKAPHQRRLPPPRYTRPASALALMDAPHLDGHQPLASRQRLRPRARPFTLRELRGTRCCVLGCRRAARAQWYTCHEGKHRAVCRRCDDMLNASVLRFFGVSSRKIARLLEKRP